MKQILGFFILLCATASFAQTPDSLSRAGQKAYIPKAGEVEIFAGAELNYRDISHEAQYEVLLYLTPAVKWHLPYRIQLAAQAQIPIVNNYGDYYKYPVLSNLTVSKEWLLFRHLAFKPTVGVFNHERYGIDLKAAYPVKPWLAFEAQVGYTGFFSLAQGWNMSKLNRILALAGANFYIPRWNTQFRVIGGRFLGEDYGVYCEGMRHFKWCTIGVYGDYSNKAIRAHGLNGGFKITMAIPPYKRKHHRVTIRPANNFLLSANMNAENLTNKVYSTDPEENSRHGWFSPDILPWGSNLIYEYKEKEATK